MENKYHPLTESEFTELKDFILNLGPYLPTEKAGWIWGNFNRIREASEPQPCTCASSGPHWKRATDEIRNWVKARM